MEQKKSFKERVDSFLDRKGTLLLVAGSLAAVLGCFVVVYKDGFDKGERFAVTMDDRLAAGEYSKRIIRFFDPVENVELKPDEVTDYLRSH